MSFFSISDVNFHWPLISRQIIICLRQHKLSVVSTSAEFALQSVSAWSVHGQCMATKSEAAPTSSPLLDSPTVAASICRNSGGLYPPIEPYNTGWLTVSDIHEIYYEECGNKDGNPVVYL